MADHHSTVIDQAILCDFIVDGHFDDTFAGCASSMRALDCPIAPGLDPAPNGRAAPLVEGHRVVVGVAGGRDHRHTLVGGDGRHLGGGQADGVRVVRRPVDVQVQRPAGRELSVGLAELAVSATGGEWRRRHRLERNRPVAWPRAEPRLPFHGSAGVAGPVGDPVLRHNPSVAPGGTTTRGGSSPESGLNPAALPCSSPSSSPCARRSAPAGSGLSRNPAAL
jgi:hypothetical protein